MLRILEPLYLSESVKGESRKIIKALRKGRADIGYFALTLAENGTDHIDVIASGYLKQKILLEKLPPLIGLSVTRAEAMDLIVRITDDCLRETGGTDLRAYLLNTKTEKDCK